MQGPVMHVFVSANEMVLKYWHFKFIVLFVKFWIMGWMGQAQVFLFIAVFLWDGFDHGMLLLGPRVDQKYILP